MRVAYNMESHFTVYHSRTLKKVCYNIVESRFMSMLTVLE